MLSLIFAAALRLSVPLPNVLNTSLRNAKVDITDVRIPFPLVLPSREAGDALTLRQGPAEPKAPHHPGRPYFPWAAPGFQEIPLPVWTHKKTSPGI